MFVTLRKLPESGKTSEKLLQVVVRVQTQRSSRNITEIFDVCSTSLQEKASIVLINDRSYYRESLLLKLPRVRPLRSGLRQASQYV